MRRGGSHRGEGAARARRGREEGRDGDGEGGAREGARRRRHWQSVEAWRK